MDISEAPLKAALAMGANVAINSAQEPDRLAADYSADKGYFDIGFECTGVGAVLKQFFPVMKPRSRIVQVGVMASADIPMNALVGKEISLVGTHRFHREYAHAARLIREGKVDVKPIITSVLPMERAAEAFNIARDRKTQMKVLLRFD